MSHQQNPIQAAKVHPTYARLLCMLLRGLGADMELALAEAGLSWEGLATEEKMLDFAVVQLLAQAAIASSGRPWLGIELGQMAHISAHGAVGSAVVASRDLRQALATVVRFSSLRNDLLRFDLDEQPSGAVLRVYESTDLGAARGFVLDTVFGTAMRLMETVVGYRLRGLRVELPFTEPAWREQYERCADGSVLVFDAPLLAFHLGAAMLEAQCITSNARAFEAAREDCERELALTAGGIGPWSQRLRQQLLQRRPPQPYPTALALAEACHVSVRTLIRRLRAEGSSYQALLDGVRQEQALWQLRHTQNSVEEIAAQLGFEDTSNFSRTVRRWFGQTPSGLRERLRA
ncbi:AraC family transcriptional regulator [Roseateles oligotrophus]|uniref:AraC family transcriptional regulator n=1 Tax=Roseateles oligotrophus TaxID=1769250 RepID=A0ABT2YBW4_9BURK|nr:AraC family transcriptional regulator [Roseateles oligotrophus]MCV2366755.1 AraC family transcriptional regulator [Roseateles oligotrophus]